MATTAWWQQRTLHGGADEIPLPDGPGRLWLCGKHYVGPDPERALETLDASTVVCLNERSELADRYPAYVEWLHLNVPTRAVWHPIPDLHAPTVEAAVALLATLRDRLGAGEAMVLHCGAGIGRAGTIAAGLLVTMGVPLAAATRTVASHRAMAGPEAGAQTALLAALARHGRTGSIDVTRDRPDAVG